MSGAIHICWSRMDGAKVRVLWCPTCKRRRRMWSWFQEWYGWHTTCLSCGDAWTDGEMHERPFRPGWRKDNIAAALASMNRWKEAHK